MPSLLESRFLENLSRVDESVSLYEKLTGGVQGRPSVHEADILRSAVVLLHAALEDLLRALTAERLPRASETALRRVPLPSGERRKRVFTLGDLAAYRGRSVDEVVATAIDAYLQRSNYGNLNKVARLLGLLSLGLPSDRSIKARVAAMMARRHLIVHRLDRDERVGRGYHPALSISRRAVSDWTDAVRQFGSAILGQV